MKKRSIIVLLILLAFVAAAAGACFWLFSSYRNDPTFLKKTTLNGEDIGGARPEKVADALAERYDTSKTTVTINEEGETAMTGTLTDFGYDCDRASFETLLQDSYQAQRRDLPTLFHSLLYGYELQSEEAYTFDIAVFDQKTRVANLAKERKETVENTTVFDEETRTYSVVPGYEGNELDEKGFYDLVLTTLEGVVEGGSLPESVEIDIPESLYTSVPPKDNLKELQKECDEKNLALRKEEVLDEYKKVTITHTFGSETEVLSNETILSWITVEDDLSVKIDENAINDYVLGLKEKYDTQWKTRSFTTTNGKKVVFPAKENEYGFRIATDSEKTKIKGDILSKKAVTRDPVYYETNDYGNPIHYKRNGADDLAGTYVEVNLTRQHLWFYKDGQLVVESDLVSGDVALGKETQTGVFPLAFKESPRTLVGDEAGGSGQYTAEVNYWMPFYDGQGLHDASWRWNFGGEIYKTNGSHGCVNLPPSKAAEIYNSIEPGMAILVYHEE